MVFPLPSRMNVLKPKAMNVTTKILITTSKLVGALLWAIVLFEYGVFEFIGQYTAAVINFHIEYLCYK